MIRILTPAEGATFPPGILIPVTGRYGPLILKTVSGPYDQLSGAVDDKKLFQEEKFTPHAGGESDWYTTVGPFMLSGYYLITVYSGDGPTDSVVIYVSNTTFKNAPGVAEK